MKNKELNSYVTKRALAHLVIIPTVVYNAYGCISPFGEKLYNTIFYKWASEPET
ncbi:MAG: hypothetical protein WCJ19_00500 [bacterium]